MAAIEVKRIGDGSSRFFDINEIGDGTLINWVTANDPNADGLVRFLNQAAESGNAMASSIDKFPKIVENGNLITDQNGNPTVKFDNRGDGYEVDFANASDIQSSKVQTVELTLNTDEFKGSPQTIVNSDGIRVWERGGKMYATITNPNTQWSNFSSAPANVTAFTSYKENLYLYSKDEEDVYKFKNDGTFEIITRDELFDTDDKASIFIYNNKLWAHDEDDHAFWSYTGTKRFVSFSVRKSGEKVYFLDANADEESQKIEEYDLSTPYDFSSSTLTNKKIAPNDLEGSFADIYVRDDGQKLYYSSYDPAKIYEYSFGTQWDLSTITFDQKIDVSGDIGDSTELRGLEFKPDGSKFYYIENNEGEIFEYDLSMPWDISTFQLNQSQDVSSEADDDIKGIFFRENGEQLFLCANLDERLYPFNLSTPWDISTLTFQPGETYIQGPGFLSNQPNGNHRDVVFNPSGDEFYTCGLSGEVGTFKLDTSWDYYTSYFQNRSVVDKEASGWIFEKRIGYNNGIYIGNQGTKMYLADPTSKDIKEYSLLTAWDVTTAIREGAFHISEFDADPQGVWVRDDGKTLYIVGEDDDAIKEFELFTPWDVSTASFVREYTFSYNPQELYFRSDGKTVYITDVYGNVREYELGTAWDITTMSQVDQISTSSFISEPNGIFFQPNGETLFITGETDTVIVEMSLSTPWDLSTASVVETRQIPEGEDTGEGLMMKPNDGGTLILSTENRTYEYTLSTPYDLSSATLTKSKLLGIVDLEATAYIPHHDGLSIVYRGGRRAAGNQSGGVIRKTDSGWKYDFLTPTEITVDLLGDTLGNGRDVDMFGGGVWRDEVYLPLFSGTSSTGSLSDIGETILKYNENNGWSTFFTFGSPSNTSDVEYVTSTPPYKDQIYALPSEDPFEAYVYKEEDQTFDKAWGVTDLMYQAATKVYDEDLYIGHWDTDYDDTVDGVYRWDGNDIQVDLQTDGGFWRALGIHKGELWASHRYTAGEVYKKGNGEELFIDYDETKDELDVTVVVTPNVLYLAVDNNEKFISHDVSYKNTGKFRLGLSYGAKHSDQHGGIDEIYKGAFKTVKRYSDVTSSVSEAIFSTGTASISIFYETPTSIEGEASYSIPNSAQKYEVFSSTSQSGPFNNLVKTVDNPSQETISWVHDNLNSGQTYYYKHVVTGPNNSAKESSIVSGFTEFIQPSAPVVSTTNTTTTSVSGTISSPDPDIFYDKFEVYFSTTSGGPYTKFTEFANVSSEQTWTHSNLQTGTTYFYVGKAIKTAGPVESPFSTQVSAVASSLTTEDFESFSLESELQNINPAFTFSGGGTWFIDDEHSRVGSQSLRSNDIGDSNSTSTTIELSDSARNQFLINWGADSESGFDEVTLYEDGSSIKTISGQNVDSQEIFSIQANTQKNIEIEYVKDASVSNYSDSAWIHYLEKDPVLSPEFTTSESGGKVTVNHQPRGTDRNNDFNGFNVYVDGVKQNSNVISRGDSYTTEILTAGDRAIGVTNERSDGQESNLTTQTVNVSAFTVPFNLQGSYDSNANEVNLTWETNDPNISHYNVYRADTSNGNFTEISASDITTKSYTDSSVIQGEGYFYKVSSVLNDGTESNLSSEIGVFADSPTTINDGSTLTLSDETVSYNALLVNGSLNIEGKVTINITFSLEVSSTGTVNGAGNGFQPASGDYADGNGPGGGIGASFDGATGASYGGRGGTAPDGFPTPPSTYGDSNTRDIQQGSSGGNGDDGSLGGAGGAALEILASTNGFSTTVDGIINFDGGDTDFQNSTREGGGGSGGGVYIESDVTGNGSITARGGSPSNHTNDGGGGGGGGRLKAESFGFYLTTDVSGGAAPGDGDPGNDGTVTEFNP